MNSKDKDGWTALHLAALYGRPKCCRVLLEDRLVEVNSQNLLGWTPLHVAAWRGHRDVAELLFAKGIMTIKPESNHDVYVHYRGVIAHKE